MLPKSTIIIRELEEITKKTDKPKWDPLHVIKCPSTSSLMDDDENLNGDGDNIKPKRKYCVPDHPIEYIDVKVIGQWSLENIAKASKLLRKPPIKVIFDDEHEMRKVYSLIYDVFRYKHVLSETLLAVSFFAHFPKLKDDESRVWLMLFELYVRHFLKRHGEEIGKENFLYKEAEVDYIAQCLWQHKVHLAAAIARLRIKSGALLLSQLLPSHLQDERVGIAVANPIITGWINPFKLKNKDLAINALKDMGLTEVLENEDENEKPLQKNQYKWDKACPLFMSCLPNNRSHFAQSEFVKKYFFVMQDRTFSIAPAVLSRLLDHFELDGDIVQTHVSSPRSTAYLAALFYSVNRVNDFLAFGAGQNLIEYENYIKMLGVNNIKLYSESFCNIPLESPILNTVVGIFATPPNSFSGISDPIDLICSRGGDLSMLAVLTESEISEDGKKRVAQLLEEQRDTLRLAMSRPQVQFVLYETHSIVDSENQDMVERAVNDINRCAFEKHLVAFKERKRLEELAEIEAANIPSAALSQNLRNKKQQQQHLIAGAEQDLVNKQKHLHKMGTSQESNTSNISLTDAASGEDYSRYIKVPKTDEFLVAEVPDVCMNQDGCLNFDTLGCFVSLLHRKEVTKLDAKYLIKMAEARGLFGNADKKKLMKAKTAKRPDKKIEKKKDTQRRSSKLKKNDIPNLIERLNQPTHCSLIRSNLKSFSSVDGKSIQFESHRRICHRHERHNIEDNLGTNSPKTNGHRHFHPHKNNNNYPSRAKLWWKSTISHLNKIKSFSKITKSNENEINNKDKDDLHMQDVEINNNTNNNNANNDNENDCSNRKIFLQLPRTETEIYQQLFFQTQFFNLNNKNSKNLTIFEKKPFPVTINQLEFRGDCVENYIFKIEKFYGLPKSKISKTKICENCQRLRLVESNPLIAFPISQSKN